MNPTITLHNLLDEAGFNWETGKVYLPSRNGGFRRVENDDAVMQTPFNLDDEQWTSYALDDWAYYCNAFLDIGLPMPVKMPRSCIELLQVEPETATPEPIRQALLRDRDLLCGTGQGVFLSGRRLHVVGFKEFGLYVAAPSEQAALKAFVRFLGPMAVHVFQRDFDNPLPELILRLGSKTILEELRKAFQDVDWDKIVEEVESR